MKIIIGSESFSPNISGVAVSTELLAHNLACLPNTEVWVFAPSRTSKSSLDKNFNDFKVLRIRSIANPFRKGFRVAYLPQKLIFKYVKKIQPDIIHLQDPTSICSSLKKAAKKFKIPVVVSNHFTLDYVLSYIQFLKFIHPQLKSFLKNYLVKFYNQCDYVICPTETVKKELKKWQVKTPIAAISNGVDLNHFFAFANLNDIYLKYHLPMNPLVLYAGRIDKDKNMSILIKAISEVVEQTQAHFVFVGGGDVLSKIKKMAVKCKVEKEITWIDWVDRKLIDLPKLYQAASLFVIPSVIETQSLVTMEAMASGLPVVGANAGALPELIKDGVNGYLYRADSSSDLSQKIIKIIKNHNLRTKMGKKSLEIISNHQISESLAKILKIYKQLTC